MKKITLDDVIAEQLKSDPEFAECYEKEQMINGISKMVQELRKLAQLTQTELAEKVGTSQSVIARLESGFDSRVPSLALLSRIASAANAKLRIEFDVEPQKP